MATIQRGPRELQLKLGKTPVWMRARLNAAFPEQVRTHLRQIQHVRRTKLNSRDEAAWFVSRVLKHLPECRCLIGIWDHWGTDQDDRLVLEPYARNCESCTKQIEWLAAKLDLRYTITQPTWWAPHLPNCVRVTFWPNGKEATR
jgi:hypothetical protein